MPGPSPTPIAARFWSKVAKTDDCWLWTAARTHDGYGTIGSSGRGGTKVYAHRFAYEALVGQIPPGLQLEPMVP